MKNKNKSIDPLPDSFETEEAAGAFWDAHSTIDYEEYLEPVAELVEFFDTHDMGENEATFPEAYFEVDLRRITHS
jgi:hypothetical protein